MNIELRQEESKDYYETENVTREAFWNYYSPACSEHYLIHIMRDDDSFIPELDVVAVVDNKIVGNVVYLKSVISGDNGKEYDVLSLGPISVLPEYQKQGIGRQLIDYTREIAKTLGFSAILLCGDPKFYGKMGFVPAESLGIRTGDNMYAAALQVCELYENALSEAKGRYIENSIYGVDEKAVAEFDKLFPFKEAVEGTPTQKRFEEVCAMMVPYLK